MRKATTTIQGVNGSSPTTVSASGSVGVGVGGSPDINGIRVLSFDPRQATQDDPYGANVVIDNGQIQNHNSLCNSNSVQHSNSQRLKPKSVKLLRFEQRKLDLMTLCLMIVIFVHFMISLIYCQIIHTNDSVYTSHIQVQYHFYHSLFY